MIKTTDTTQNRAPSAPREAHQQADLKTADEMRSAIDTFKAELGKLNDWDNAALDKLWGWMSVYMTTIEIEMSKRRKF